ncbi:VOC family protein [Aureibacillus halotolerans]|uniref:Catechol 2,3-dioxygenase-like lactoylglutathione lyase family enzyme n=1 Tax=Aureibacillus halotolerans TaxID=1508390 RepID=A0A4V6PWJ8_9BACI|nr:VOC family protein [Aureibacillus halotolerans]TDQ42027.1 catechol 2,3-dioxygenase-like lactoylglutathione lyase family enzyme [Aureibacillus halotolerans]
MIEFAEIHHVTLAVTDIKKAAQFYENVLGMTPRTDRPDFGFPGAWYSVGNQQLHLISVDDAKTLRGSDEIDSRDGHLALKVVSIPSLLKKLDEAGVLYQDRPDNKTPWHQVYVTDPSGNVIEFNAPRS